MAEDIALAVEYTLLNSNRPDAVFGQGELAAAVIRMLEETGFPEVAALFRQSGGDRQVAVDADPVSVAGFLQKFLACSDTIFDRVVHEVARAVEILGIHEADPHLYLELARYYERKFAIESITAARSPGSAAGPPRPKPKSRPSCRPKCAPSPQKECSGSAR